MTDFRDPNLRDPTFRDPSFRDPASRFEMDRRDAMNSNSTWGWIAGGVFLVLVLAVIFGLGGNDTRTAGTMTSPPAATTGSGSTAPPAAPAPAR